MKLKEFFNAFLDIPIRRLELIIEETEKLKRDRYLEHRCLLLLKDLPRIYHEDIVQARESLIQGDSLEAVKALILYINKTSK
jgi:hypothetical protein